MRCSTVRLNCRVTSEWREEGNALRRDFDFADFDAAWAFMCAVAALARELDHHPDWSNSWNKVTIALTSHDVGRVTGRDRRMAEAIDRLLLDGTVSGA